MSLQGLSVACSPVLQCLHAAYHHTTSPSLPFTPGSHLSVSYSLDFLSLFPSPCLPARLTRLSFPPLFSPVVPHHIIAGSPLLSSLFFFFSFPIFPFFNFPPFFLRINLQTFSFFLLLFVLQVILLLLRLLQILFVFAVSSL